MNNRQVKQIRFNLDHEMKDLAIAAILEFAKAFRMTVVVDKNIVEGPELIKNGQIKIDATKVCNIIIIFNDNEIHIVGKCDTMKSVPSNAN